MPRAVSGRSDERQRAVIVNDRRKTSWRLLYWPSGAARWHCRGALSRVYCPVMRFEKIWIEQCRATRAIKRRFGAKDALDYLVGEKLRMFAEAARHDVAFARELPRFSQRSGAYSTSTSSSAMSQDRSRPCARSSGRSSTSPDASEPFGADARRIHIGRST
jgi:hypothetical protein